MSSTKLQKSCLQSQIQSHLKSQVQNHLQSHECLPPIEESVFSLRSCFFI